MIFGHGHDHIYDYDYDYDYDDHYGNDYAKILPTDDAYKDLIDDNSSICYLFGYAKQKANNHSLTSKTTYAATFHTIVDKEVSC